MYGQYQLQGFISVIVQANLVLIHLLEEQIQPAVDYESGR